MMEEVDEGFVQPRHRTLPDNHPCVLRAMPQLPPPTTDPTPVGPRPTDPTPVGPRPTDDTLVDQQQQRAPAAAAAHPKRKRAGSAGHAPKRARFAVNVDVDIGTLGAKQIKHDIAAIKAELKQRQRADAVAALPSAKELNKRLRDLQRWLDTGGAIMAKSRTGEGYVLASGDCRSCVPDAVWNGARELKVALSLRRLRSLSIPKLGIAPEASWASTMDSLGKLGAPLKLVRLGIATLLDVLKAPPGIYIVRLLVVADDVDNMHAVMLSTIPEENTPHGKLIDNSPKQKPIYLEAKDKKSKKTARWAFESVLTGQVVVADSKERRINLAGVYRLDRTPELRMEDW
eukprot:m.97375 g.97375  ORF g.97375 m.97375 type:complete len:344 (+) comp12397_c0_seq2:881-1912(+)